MTVTGSPVRTVTGSRQESCRHNPGFIPRIHSIRAPLSHSSVFHPCTSSEQHISPYIYRVSRYRGRKEINKTKIMISDLPKKSDSRYQKLKKHKLFCKRAGMEPTTGHLKSDYRLGRNFYL